MPTTYAHDRFGREVYEQLPANLKKIIRENKKLYLIGLHFSSLLNVINYAFFECSFYHLQAFLHLLVSAIPG